MGNKYKMKSLLEKFNLFSLGQKSFLLGAFFLASALPISGFFFLFAIIFSLINNKSTPFKGKWNYPLYLAIGLIIFSTINNTIFNFSSTAELDKTNIFVGIFNWIPLFFSFWGFQAYLKTDSQRKLFANYLFTGSIPVILSCILQYWFEIYGPFEAFNGLIVWFQKPLSGNTGVSGLFSNQNYAGLWLSAIWPFSIFISREFNKNVFLKICFIILSFLILYFTFLANSRNSVIGILISILILFKLKFFFIFILFILIFLGLYFSLVNFSIIRGFTPNSFLPIDLIEQIYNFRTTNLLDTARFEIWEKAIKLILEKPLLGWGASTFAIVYKLKGGFYEIQHTHSMPFELAYNFGIPLALILCSFSIYLLFKGWKIIINRNKNNFLYLDINLYWLTSLTIVFLSHVNDISYYDGKISLLIWILLAGVKCMNDEKDITIN